jgi:hypothetical protein
MGTVITIIVVFVMNCILIVYDVKPYIICFFDKVCCVICRNDDDDKMPQNTTYQMKSKVTCTNK